MGTFGALLMDAFNLLEGAGIFFVMQCGVVGK